MAGAGLSGPAGEPPEGRRSIGPALARGVERAFVALVVTGALAEVVAFGVWLASGRVFSPALVAKLGALVFFWFHHVGLEFHPARGPFGGVSAGRGSITLGLALMLGTAVAAWLLHRAGRAVARAANVTGPALAPLGLAVAIPYTVLSVAGSFLARPTVAPVDTIRPSPAQAALWPLALSAVFACLGALAEARRGVGTTRAVADGAKAMAMAGLALSFAGLLVLAAVQPGATRRYVGGAFVRGPVRGAAVLGVTALVVPNVSAWVLGASTGDCIALQTSSTGAGCFLSYGRIPAGTGPLRAVGIGPGVAPPVGERRPPGAYWLFLLVPALATTWGGAVAGRRADPAAVGRAVAAGAGSGLLFAAFATLAFALSSVNVAVAGRVGIAGSAGGGSLTASLGPRLGVGAALAAAWGVGGGVIGALLVEARTSRPAAADAGTP